MSEGLILLIVGGVLAAGVMVAIGAMRIGVPSLVAFLVLGMLLGSEGLGVGFNDEHLARTVGVIGLSLILFEGGLSTSWRRLREVVVPAAMLSTLGVLITAFLTGLIAYALLDISWLSAFLLGAVVSSTDAAAVFATLRYTEIRRRLARTLEAESGGNDPMAIALTIGLISWIEMPSFGAGDFVQLIVHQLGLGMLVGLLMGAAAMYIFARLPNTIGAFAPVTSVAAFALTFGLAHVIGGSGFLAVYMVGLAIGSTPSRYRHQLVTFHEGLAFIAQVTMFVVLGLLVVPHALWAVAAPSIIIAVLLIVFVRPIAVWISTYSSHFTRNERGLLGWAGLRGALPIVLGTFVLSANIPNGALIFNVVFFVVLISALIQGTTLEWVARKLGVIDKSKGRKHAKDADPNAIETVEFIVDYQHSINGAAIREIGLPRQAKVTSIKRRGKTKIPISTTVIKLNDRLFVSVPVALRPELEDVFMRWRRRV